MKKILNQQFSQTSDNLFVLQDKFTFWEFIKILRKNDYNSEEALNFIFANCSLSAGVFQECIINNKYTTI